MSRMKNWSLVWDRLAVRERRMLAVAVVVLLVAGLWGFAIAPARIVVGDPIGLDGRRGIQSRAAARFGRHIAARFEIPVDQLDERLTTVEAARRRRETGAKGDLDSLAACVLLEAYLAGAR